MSRSTVLRFALLAAGVAGLAGSAGLFGPGAGEAPARAAVASAPTRARAPAAAREALHSEPARPSRSAVAREPDTAGGVADIARRLQERAQRVRDALENLPGGENAPLRDQLAAYRRALDDNLGPLPFMENVDSRDVMAEAFLWTGSVQKQLAALTPERRESELENIRRELGYSDDELRALAQVDAAREARWQNGLAYMRERSRLAASFEADALQEELRRLRERYFADEAQTIELEERDGFFRYERPRVYGRN